MLMPIIKRRRPRSYSADWVRRDEVRKDREVLADRRASATLLMLQHQVHGEPRFGDDDRDPVDGNAEEQVVGHLAAIVEQRPGGPGRRSVGRGWG